MVKDVGLHGWEWVKNCLDSGEFKLAAIHSEIRVLLFSKVEECHQD
jgi:hypothetical protein